MSHKRHIRDVSMLIHDGMFTYPGNPPAVIRGPYSAVRGGDREYCYELLLTTQTGTHIQGPHYFLENGQRLGEIPLDRFEGAAVIVEGEERIDGELIADRVPIEREDESVLIIRTGYMDGLTAAFGLDGPGTPRDADLDRLFGERPYLTPCAAREIVEGGFRMLGIDAPGIESPEASGFEVNRYLCEKGVLILEGLVNLAGLPTRGSWLSAFPLKLEGVEGSPVRAIIRC